MAIEIPFPLLTDIAEGRCLPFIGAGFSMNAKLPDGKTMPDWPALARTLARDAKTPDGLSPTVVAEKYEKRFGRVQLVEAIRRALHSDMARPGKAHLAFASLPFDTIYTTNFDLLLEESYSSIGRPFRSLVGERQLPFHAGRTASSIIKMHGDLRHEEHIVVTQKDYDSFLEENPVVATHLAAMLITRTPLFIGYSLNDPDFHHIRSVVRSRLGQFERMSYVVQFDYSEESIENALQDRLNVISLSTQAGFSRDELLEQLLLAISEDIDVEAGIRLRRSRPDIFEPIIGEAVEKATQSVEFSRVVEATSSLCFVMMSFGGEFDRVYRTLITPAAQRLGLEVVRADEISGPGFVMEQIRTAIMQSRLCIADISDRNPNVLYELGIAQANQKPTIIIAQDLMNLPFDVAGQRILRYGDAPEEAQKQLEAAIGHVLSDDSINDAERLLASGQYRASVSLASVSIEHRLRSLVQSRIPTQALERLSPARMVNLLLEGGILTQEMAKKLHRAIKIRNKAVHTLTTTSPNDAALVLSVAREL